MSGEPVGLAVTGIGGELISHSGVPGSAFSSETGGAPEPVGAAFHTSTHGAAFPRARCIQPDSRRKPSAG